jgi:hypothetical protein
MIHRMIGISICLLGLIQIGKSQSTISLYNRQGNAEAYIDPGDDNTIYLWSGKPVAYLANGDHNVNIYGFNGKHLGWYIRGVVIDHQGDVVAFSKGAVDNIPLQYEAYKGYKEYKPYKGYPEYEPYLPYLTSHFSNTPFQIFLQFGIGENDNAHNQKIFRSSDPVMPTDVDLLANVNRQKQAAFDAGTKQVQGVTDQIAGVLTQILQGGTDSAYYFEQVAALKKYINAISATPIDYSDKNQLNAVIGPLNSQLAATQQELLYDSRIRTIVSKLGELLDLLNRIKDHDRFTYGKMTNDISVYWENNFRKEIFFYNFQSNETEAQRDGVLNNFTYNQLTSNLDSDIDNTRYFVNQKHF